MIRSIPGTFHPTSPCQTHQIPLLSCALGRPPAGQVSTYTIHGAYLKCLRDSPLRQDLGAQNNYGSLFLSPPTASFFFFSSCEDTVPIGIFLWVPSSSFFKGTNESECLVLLRPQWIPDVAEGRCGKGPSGGSEGLWGGPCQVVFAEWVLGDVFHITFWLYTKRL